MFNGIIYNQGVVRSIASTKNSAFVEIYTKFKFKKSDLGCSISCNGVCLTLTKIKKNLLFFYLSKETIKRSAFKNIKIGDSINLEKSLAYGQKISGHYVQGHVDTTGFVQKITLIDKSWIIKISILKSYNKLLVEKASISINGVSLTVSKVSKTYFEISIIPHTLKMTNLIKLKVKDLVNIEIDIFSKYLKNLNN